MKTSSVLEQRPNVLKMHSVYTLPICIEDNVYGVIAIPVDEYTLDSFEYSILLSVINECALAMENKKNIMEKEKNLRSCQK